MRYKGFFIENNYGHYEIYQGDDLVFTADTISEAKDACDDMEADMCEYANSLKGQWW